MTKVCLWLPGSRQRFAHSLFWQTIHIQPRNCPIQNGANKRGGSDIYLISINNLIVRASRVQLIKTLDWSVNQLSQLSSKKKKKKKYVPGPSKPGACLLFLWSKLWGKQPGAVMAGYGRQRASFWSGPLRFMRMRGSATSGSPPSPPSLRRVGCTQSLSTQLESPLLGWL